MKLTLSSIEYATKTNDPNRVRALRLFAILVLRGKSRMMEGDAKAYLLGTGWVSRYEVKRYMAWLIEHKWIRQDKNTGLLFLCGLDFQINRFGKTKRQRYYKIDPLAVVDAVKWRDHIWGLQVKNDVAQKAFCDNRVRGRRVYGSSSTINSPSTHAIKTDFSLNAILLRHPGISVATACRIRQRAMRSGLVNFSPTYAKVPKAVQRRFLKYGKAYLAALITPDRARRLVVVDGWLCEQKAHTATIQARWSERLGSYSDDGRYTSRNEGCKKPLFLPNGWPQNAQNHA